MRYGCALGMVLLGLAGSGRAADEVVFRNGDRLTGRVESLVSGTLHFASEMAGTVQLDVARVQALRMETPAEIHLPGSGAIQDVLVPDETAGPGGVRVASLGRSLPLEEVEAINPPEPDRWKGRVTGGAAIQRGNAHTQGGHAAFETTRSTERHRLHLDAAWEAQRTRDQDTGEYETNRRRLVGGVKLDRRFGERGYAYVGTRAERDGVADLDLRLENGAGVGRDWVDREDLSFSTEAGLEWVREDYGDDAADDDFAAGRLAWNLHKRLVDGVAFFHDGSWVASLEDRHDQIVETETGVRSELGAHLFLESKVRWRWDASPAADRDREDVDYLFGVGYDF